MSREINFECERVGEDSLAVSMSGLDINSKVKINGDINIDKYMHGQNGARVYEIKLTKNNYHYKYGDYVLTVDAKGPKEFDSGSWYLTFTDKSGNSYLLDILDSSMKKYTLRYNSSRPQIQMIRWMSRTVRNELIDSGEIKVVN